VDGAQGVPPSWIPTAKVINKDEICKYIGLINVNVIG